MRGGNCEEMRKYRKIEGKLGNVGEVRGNGQVQRMWGELRGWESGEIRGNDKRVR